MKIGGKTFLRTTQKRMVECCVKRPWQIRSTRMKRKSLGSKKWRKIVMVAKTHREY